MDKEKMFEAIAKDFKKAVREYRRVRRDVHRELYGEGPAIVSLYETTKITGNPKVKYWEEIIRSKIEVIGAIGGVELMQEFSYYLASVDNGELNLESAFCYLADGICNWCY